jgi:hypothetical protein
MAMRHNVFYRDPKPVSIDVASDIDAHGERARAPGARIIAEPATQFFGERVSRAGPGRARLDLRHTRATPEHRRNGRRHRSQIPDRTMRAVF